MLWLLYLFVFIFGTIIGSFLNVVICRHGTGRSLGGRSKCAVTGKTLKWFELIPIFSFLIQGGRSRYSKSKISLQYPLVELATGLTFAVLFCKLLPLASHCGVFVASLLFYFAIFSFLILIFVYDLRHKMIPDAFLYPLMTLAFAGALFLPVYSSPTLVSLLAGPILALPLIFIFLITRGKGMGFGDVLLVIPFGWMLGLSGGLAALLLSFWIGAIVGVTLMITGEKKMKSEIPFGPFLILGFTLAFLYNIDMVSIARFFGSLI